ncbi:MAG: BTAD domain-containing putative transcriptional regulator [Gemmatimonadota bacterium]
MFFLRTFGGLSLEQDGRPLDELTGNRKALILLAILAADEVVGRDRLLALLWPESDTERARGSLRQALHWIRQALGESDVVSGTAELRLNPLHITSDVGAFLYAVRTHDATTAIDAYRGTFLDAVHTSNTVEFEQWLDHRRGELRQLYATQLEQLAERAEAKEDFAAAVALWRKRQDVDPANGIVAARLIRALDAAGERAAALRHAQLHASVLKDEFELPPDPAVAALAEEVRTREPPLHSKTIERIAMRVPGPRMRRHPATGLLAVAAVIVLVIAGGLTAAASRSRGAPRSVAATPASQDKARALEYLVKAQQLLQRHEVQATIDAKTYLAQAVALDPELIDAQLALARTELSPALTDPEPRVARAKTAAERVLALDSTNVAAHTMMVMVKTIYDRDLPAAERHYRRGYAVDPSDAGLHNAYTMLLLTRGQIEESLRPMQRAYELRPAALSNLAYLAVRYLMLGKPEQAQLYIDQSLALDSAFFMTHWAFGRLHLAQGKYDDALREFAYPGTDLGGIGQQAFIGYTLARAGRTAEARALIARLLEQRRSGGYVSPVDIAIVYIGLGDRDQALDWLGQLVDKRGQRIFLKADPIFDPVRADARFTRLLAALNLPS